MKNLLMGILMFTVMACGDDGGNGGGAPGFNHKELASEFVTNLNLDAEFDVTLVKGSTRQKDFIVIYDPLTDSYDAVDIQNYDPALDNASDYYNQNSGNFYYDLDEIPGHTEVDEVSGWLEDADGDSYWGTWEESYYVKTAYRDRNSNMYFEKVAASSKDLVKMAAIKEAAKISKSAQFLSSKFGLSINRGQEIARLTSHWKKASKKAMTTAEVDSFSTELLGFSLSSGVSAYKSSMEGDSSSLSDLIKKSAAANGITPEHASKLMTKLFSL